MQRQIQLQLFSNNGHQHVRGDGDPYLALDRVLGCAEKAFDAQMLFDPFKEQLNLPAAFVRRANAQCRDGEVVGQKYERLLCLRVLETHSTQLSRIILRGVEIVEHDALIANQSRAVIDGRGVHALEVHIAFGARHKEPATQVQSVQSGEFQIAPIHDVERASFGDQQIEHIDVVPFSVVNMHKTGDVAAQVQQRMQEDQAHADLPDEHRPQLR